MGQRQWISKSGILVDLIKSCRYECPDLTLDRLDLSSINGLEVKAPQSCQSSNSRHRRTGPHGEEFFRFSRMRRKNNDVRCGDLVSCFLSILFFDEGEQRTSSLLGAVECVDRAATKKENRLRMVRPFLVFVKGI